MYNKYLSTSLKHKAARTYSMGGRKQWFLDNYSRYLPTSWEATCLEIGPGMGESLEVLAELGYKNVHAVDVSEEVVKWCNQKFPGSTDLIDNLPYFLERHSEKYELIIMLHVIEHLPSDDVVRCLHAASGALKPNGRILIETPNLANPIVGLILRYGDLTHTLGFVEASLAQAFRLSGFDGMVEIHGGVVNRSTWTRRVQWAIQKIIEAMMGLLVRIYMPAAVPVLTQYLIAVGTKSAASPTQTM